MSSILNKFTHNNQTGVAQPYTQQQLLAQQQGQIIGSPMIGSPAFGTQTGLVGSGALLPVGQQQFVGQQQLVGQQQIVGQQQVLVNEPATTTTLQPIVQQSIRQDRVVEVQPIIHRDIERPVVNHIERHITEAAPASRAGAIQHGAIVEERVHNRVVNEIQPVIHREIAVPQVEQVQQHFVERVVATPQHTRQVVYEQIPAVQGQQYIQQGLGTQQYLQTGLVQRSTLLATQQPGFLGTQQFGTQGIPLNYNQQSSLLTQQPILGQQSSALITQQSLVGQPLYSTGYGQRDLVGGYGTGIPYGSGIGGGYGLTKAEQKEEKTFERNLNRQHKRIEKEQAQVQRHQLRQFEQQQNEQNLLARHQMFQQQQSQRQLLGGSPLLAGPGFGSRGGIYTADPPYSQQYVSTSPIYGQQYGTGLGGLGGLGGLSGLEGQQYLAQPYGQQYGTGLGGFGGLSGLEGQQYLNQPYGTGLQGQQFLNQGLQGQGLQGQQFLNQGLQGQQFNQGGLNQGLQGQQYNQGGLNQGLQGQGLNQGQQGGLVNREIHNLENQALNREHEQEHNQHNNQL